MPASVRTLLPLKAGAIPARIARAAALVLWTSSICLAQGSGENAADHQFFETQIRPLLAQQCYSCHGPDKQFAGLRLDSRARMLSGGASGPAVVAGDPQSSLLMRAVRGESLRMPLNGQLTGKEIGALAAWIGRGAPWPPEIVTTGDGDDRYEQLIRTHWAFQPVQDPALPTVSYPRWSQNPIDRFIASRLHAEGMLPAPPATRQTLAKRLSYALTGLPPTAADVQRFAHDGSSSAYEALVDRLLATPQFGEHWARHWLDLVRFAETRGYEWNYEIVGGWRYRDYIVRAFNEDVPYDQLVREHIAGDLLPRPRINAEQQLNESVIGTAFYRLGEAGHDDCVQFREIALDVVDNEIDVLSKTFQGVTVACARCHDHKLDPIPTTDYYGLYSILNSSRVTTHTIDAPQAREATLARLRALKAKIRAELATVWGGDVGQLSEHLQAKLTLPGAAERAIDDPSYLLYTMTQGVQHGESFAGLFEATANTLRQEQQSRAKSNRDNFQEFGDFRHATPEGWTTDGLGLRQGPSASGEFAVAADGPAAIDGVLPAGRYTHTLSARLNGAIRSPWLPRGPKKLSLNVVGGMLGARRTVIDNCAIGEDYKFVDAHQPEWITIDLPEKWNGLPRFVELVTRWDNPRIPDRPDRIKEPDAQFLQSPTSYFGIVDAVLHDGDEPPAKPLDHLLPLLAQPAPTGIAELAHRYEALSAAVIERWRQAESTDEDAAWLAWLLDEELLTNRLDASAALLQLIAEYRRIESELPAPRVVEGLEDAGDGREFPVLVSGSAQSPGEPAPRRFLSRLYGPEPFTQHGSGRLELANLLTSEKNPLTARVMVNRVWSHLFGRGIVSTVDDFGSLGERPSHPALLDYLATRFVADGWSVKSLIRLIVTSQAFQQSGRSQFLEQDPQNVLLSHFPMRRLSAEEIRDSLLAVSGELRSDLGGPSIDPYRREPKPYRRLFAGPLLGEGRRSLYLKVTRMEGASFLETFDFPMPSTTRGSRDATTVPAQSLAMLNDPMVLAIAERCAEGVLSRSGPGSGERIEALFRRILARPPTPDEAARFSALADQLATLESEPRESNASPLTVWTDVAHVLLNTKEFLYVE